MTRRAAVLLAVFTLAAAAWMRFGRWWPSERVVTAHFVIRTTCDRATAEAAGARCEAVLAAFAAGCGQALPARPGHAVSLYRDRAELKRWNPGSGWAEGFYDGTSHSYAEPGFTVLAHETVHQLVRELAGWRLERWQDEGLATLFSVAAVREGRLDGDALDPEAYPLNRVRGLLLSGDRTRDRSDGRWVDLAVALAAERPADMDRRVSLYYAMWWGTSQVLWFGCGDAVRQRYLELLSGRLQRARFDAEVVRGLELEARVYDLLCRRSGRSLQTNMPWNSRPANGASQGPTPTATTAPAAR